MKTSVLLLASAVVGCATAGSIYERPVSAQSVQVLDLSTLPVVISKRGTYVLDRSWVIEDGPTTIINVRGNNVVLDLRGFDLQADNQGNVIRISGANVTVRNGRVIGGDTSLPVYSIGAATVLEQMNLAGYQSGPDLRGSGAVLRESIVTNRFGPTFGAGAVVERNKISCSQSCVGVGANSRVVGNEILGSPLFSVAVYGDGTVVSDNLLRVDPNEEEIVIRIRSGHNVVRDNTIVWSSAPSVVISVEGGGNVIDGNIGAQTAPDAFAPRANVGIRFTADGNFYGGNRLSALVLVDQGGTVQTDWGGNVAY